MIAQYRNDANEISKCASYNIMHISIKKKSPSVPILSSVTLYV